MSAGATFVFIELTYGERFLLILPSSQSLPISRKLPRSKAAEAQAAAEKGGVGMVLLVA